MQDTKMTEINNNKVVEFYQVPEKCVGMVIGKKGSEVRQIQQNAGCRVQMEQDNTSVNGFRNCILEGSAAQVAMARQMITSVINRNNQPQGIQSNDVTEDYPIPNEKCGQVIGKGGETIRMVKEQSGLKSCSVVKATPTSKSRPVRMFGSPAAIETAKQLVNNIMNNNDNNNHSPIQTRPIPLVNEVNGGAPGLNGHGDGPQKQAKGGVMVPGIAAGLIIGKGGKMIKRLAQETGAKIQFKSYGNTEDCLAVIMGTHDQIFRATMCITDIVNRAIKYKGGVSHQPVRVQSVFWMHVPANKAGLVFGKGGKNIKQIERESGAYCGLAPLSEQKKENEKVFEIRGTPQQIHHASHLVRLKAGEIRSSPLPAGGQQFQQQQFQPFQLRNFQQQNTFVHQQPQPASFPWNYTLPQPHNQQEVYQTPTSQIQLQSQESYQQSATLQNDQTVSSANSTTPDYSAQLAANYRSMGLADRDTILETQMRRNQAAWFPPFSYLCYPPPVQNVKNASFY